MTFMITCTFKESSVNRRGFPSISSWDAGRAGSLVCSLQLFGHGPSDPFLVGFDPSLSSIRLAHSLDDPLTACGAMLLSTSCLAVLDDVLALWAVAVVTVFLQILLVNPHLSSGSWCRGVCGELTINREVLELHTFPFLALS